LDAALRKPAASSHADAVARFEEGIDPDTATVRARSVTADIRAAVQMREAV